MLYYKHIIEIWKPLALTTCIIVLFNKHAKTICVHPRDRHNIKPCFFYCGTMVFQVRQRIEDDYTILLWKIR